MVILEVTGQVGVLQAGGAAFVATIVAVFDASRVAGKRLEENKFPCNKTPIRQTKNDRKSGKFLIKKVWEVYKWFYVGCETLIQEI